MILINGLFHPPSFKFIIISLLLLFEGFFSLSYFCHCHPLSFISPPYFALFLLISYPIPLIHHLLTYFYFITWYVLSWSSSLHMTTPELPTISRENDEDHTESNTRNLIGLKSINSDTHLVCSVMVLIFAYDHTRATHCIQRE